jgi:hypothetical protein
VTAAAAADPRAVLRDLEWSGEDGTECPLPRNALAAATVKAYVSPAEALADASAVLAAMDRTIADPRVDAEDAAAFRHARDAFAEWASAHARGNR